MQQRGHNIIKSMEIDKYKKIRDMYRPKSPFEEETRATMRPGKSTAQVPPSVERSTGPSFGEMFSEQDIKNMNENVRKKRERKAEEEKLRKEEELTKEKGAEQVQTAIDKGLISTKKDPLKL